MVKNLENKGEFLMKNKLILAAILCFSFLAFKAENSYAMSNEVNLKNTVAYTDSTDIITNLDGYEDGDYDDLEYIQLEGKYSVAKPIRLTVDEKLARGSVSKYTVFLFDENGDAVESRIMLSNNALDIMIIPTKPLNYSSTYMVFLTSDIKTASGINFNDGLVFLDTEARPKNAKQDVTKVKKPYFAGVEVEEFIAVALLNSDAEIVKWNTGLKVALLGSPTANDKKMVASALKELSALTGLSATVTTKSKANVSMYFGKASWGKKYIKSLPTNSKGYYLAEYNAQKFVDKSSIFINTTISKAEKNYLIYKTLAMTLGFQKENYVKGSIFNRYGKTGAKYSTQDKAMIKALYSPYIPVGTTAEDLREMFRYQ